jgi:hypothetical protein
MLNQNNMEVWQCFVLLSPIYIALAIIAAEYIKKKD